MTTLLSYLRLLFLSISGMLLLCTVFAANADLVNGIVTGKTCWFHIMMLAFAGSTLFMEITIKKTNNIKIVMADGLILLYSFFTLVTYDWVLNPEPEKLLFGGQLVMLWFMLRLTFANYQSLLMFYVSIIICTGIFEAVWGMMQLYGLSISNHSLFRVTGSFFNPGPFSGYIAAILPLSFGFMLRFSNCRKYNIAEPRTTLYYLSMISCILIVLILPACMSRSAWVAAIVSCTWVYVNYRIGWKGLQALWEKHRKRSIAILAVSIVALCIGMFAIYTMKKDSADGRLLMWSITAKAIKEHPLEGVGLGGFPTIYAQTQAEYFSSGEATDTEKLIAGCPEYAFNEFLQIGLEQGLIGLFVFIFWMGGSLYYGVKSKRYGITGGLISLMIFAFSSYPFQLPSFWILLVFYSVICVSTNRVKGISLSGEKRRFPYIVITAIGCALLFMGQKEMQSVYRQWADAKVLYNNEGYTGAIDSYVMLYPHLRHKHEFLFEYSQCLSKTGNNEQAKALLQRAMQLSSDPMIYYMMAKNEQKLKEYVHAEKLLFYAINILPERIYPFYLLVKLYAEPDFFQPEKLKHAASVVLNKQPKVENKAITDMRREVKKVLSSISQ